MKSYISLAVVAIIVIGGSIYLYTYSRGQDQAISQALSSSQNIINASNTLSDPATRLAQAKARVVATTADLNLLIQKSDGEQAANAIINKEYSDAADAVGKTDILFKNPDSNSPQLVVKIQSPNIQKEIEAKRLEITQILTQWRNLFASSTSSTISQSALQSVLLSSSVKIDPALIKKAEDEIVIVQAYLAQLEILVKGLTPDNSGLTAEQIKEYQALVDNSKNQIDNIVAIMTSIEVSLQAKAENNTQGSGSAQSGGAPINPLVTDQQIQAQEQAVRDAQAQQALIESQIAQAQMQAASTATSTQGGAISGGNIGGPGFSQNKPAPTGAPKLIQGDNDN